MQTECAFFTAVSPACLEALSRQSRFVPRLYRSLAFTGPCSDVSMSAWSVPESHAVICQLPCDSILHLLSLPSPHTNTVLSALGLAIVRPVITSLLNGLFSPFRMSQPTQTHQYRLVNAPSAAPQGSTGYE